MSEESHSIDQRLVRLGILAAVSLAGYVTLRHLLRAAEPEGKAAARWRIRDATLAPETRSQLLKEVLDPSRLSFIAKEAQDDICAMSAVELLRHLHSADGSVGARAAMRHSIASAVHAHAIFPFLSSCLFAEGIAAGEAVDRLVASGEPVGPLAGLPISISHGVYEDEAAVVASLQALGAIPFSTTICVEQEEREHLSNPQGPQYFCGRLLGAADAAHVASGGSFLSVTRDCEGSLRAAAHCSGVPAFVPSPGYTEEGEARIAFVARAVADLQLVAKVLAAGNETEEEIDGQEKVGILRMGPDRTHASSHRAVSEARAALEEAGHKVELFQCAAAGQLVHSYKRLRQAKQRRWQSAEQVRQLEEEVAKGRQTVLQAWRQQGFGLLLSPACRRSPDAMCEEAQEEETDHLVLMTALRVPVGVVPLLTVGEADGSGAVGAPVGVQVAGLPGSDSLCLRAMQLLEEASIAVFARDSGVDELEEEEKEKVRGFPPCQQQRLFLFRHAHKFGNYGCMDRPDNIKPKPLVF